MAVPATEIRSSSIVLIYIDAPFARCGLWPHCPAHRFLSLKHLMMSLREISRLLSAAAEPMRQAAVDELDPRVPPIRGRKPRCYEDGRTKSRLLLRPALIRISVGTSGDRLALDSDNWNEPPLRKSDVADPGGSVAGSLLEQDPRNNAILRDAAPPDDESASVSVSRLCFRMVTRLTALNSTMASASEVPE
jgi:hypothetical protein